MAQQSFSIGGYGFPFYRVTHFYPVEETNGVFQWGYKLDNGVFEFFPHSQRAEAKTEYDRFVSEFNAWLDRRNSQLCEELMNIGAFIGIGATAPIEDDMASAYVLKLDRNNTQHIDHGPFWTPDTEVEGDFFWEFWVAPEAGAEYVISDGNGGAHALLFGFGGGDGVTSYLKLTGNVYNGSSNTSFGGFDGVALGEICHISVGWDGAKITVYMNGVPCGVIEFNGPRIAQFGQLYIGGSDHSNFTGRIASARGWEGINPIKQASGQHVPFKPSCPFPAHYVNPGGETIPASFLAYYDRPFTRFVEDYSLAGYNGQKHPGIIRGGGNGLVQGDYREVADSFPIAAWVKDDRFPQNRYTSPAPMPTSLALTPPPTPSGALIFDSFSRPNQTKAFTANPSLGSTESGSLGPKAWDVGTFGPFGSSDWGIQNGRAFSYAINAGLALVDAQTANHTILCDKYEPTYGTGEMVIAFRVVDRDNLLLVSNHAESLTPGARKIYFWTVIDGSVSQAANATPPLNWTTLKIVANGTTIDVFCDETQVHHLTGVSTHQAGTRVGMAAYTTSHFGYMRWDNFTVLHS